MNKYDCEDSRIKRIQDAGKLAGFIGVCLLMMVDLDPILMAVGL